MSDRGLWVYDRELGWAYNPHATGDGYLGGPDKAAIRTNALGLRAPEVAVSKPAGTYRVLVLGDSFAFGLGVDYDHTFGAVLQTLLTATVPLPEVINMGVSGYSTDQEMLLYRRLGHRLAADFVILVACDNDFEGNVEDFAYQAYYKPYFVLDRGALVRHNSPVPRLSAVQNAKLWLCRHSNLWNAVRARRPRAAAVRGKFAGLQVAKPWHSDADPVELFSTLVRVLAAQAHEDGAAFLLVNTADRSERTVLFQALRPRLRTDGVRFLRLEGKFARARTQNPDRLWDFGRDTHWNVDSHRLAATLVHEEIRSQLAARDHRP